MRHDAHRYIRHDVERFFLPRRCPEELKPRYPKHLERRDSSDEEHALPPAECDAIENERLAIRREIASLRLELALAKLGVPAGKANFNPDQPRVPRGDPYGGRWAQDGSGSASTSSTEFSASSRPGFSRVKGHHYVHRSLYKDLPLRPETRSVFDKATTGQLNAQPHRWSREHDSYNRAVTEKFDSYLTRHNIRPEQLTPQQAQAFVDEVKGSSDPRIRDFNVRIIRRELLYQIRRVPRRE